MQQKIYSWFAQSGVALGRVQLIQNIGSWLFGLFWHIPLPNKYQRQLLKNYVHHYDVHMDEAKLGIDEFKTLHELFTREINPHSRPIDACEHAIVSPVDGTVQNWGTVAGNKLIQAKGIDYTLEQLIPSPCHRKFRDGQFITIYLSPGDAHHLFSPVEGHIVGYTYVPGALFPLREPYLSSVNGLYTRNERLITYLQTKQGLIAVVKIGAFGVGSITTAYDPTIRTNRLIRKAKSMTYSSSTEITRGENLATFHIGSTVVLLFQKQCMVLAEMHSGKKICYGQRIGLWQQ